jgi:hypothetical protein
LRGARVRCRHEDACLAAERSYRTTAVLPTDLRRHQVWIDHEQHQVTPALKQATGDLYHLFWPRAENKALVIERRAAVITVMRGMPLGGRANVEDHRILHQAAAATREPAKSSGKWVSALSTTGPAVSSPRVPNFFAEVMFIQKNRPRTTVAEPIGETLAELPFTGDQAVCLGHDQAAWSGPASTRGACPATIFLDILASAIGL